MFYRMLTGLCLVVFSSLGISETLDTAIENLSKGLVNNRQMQENATIAIVSFTSDQCKTKSPLGEFIAEDLITRIFERYPDSLDVIEKSQLDKVIAEHKFSRSGLYDIDNLKVIGKFVSATHIVSGKLTNLGKYIKVNSRIISMETSKIVGAASVKIDVKGLPIRLCEEVGKYVSKSDGLLDLTNNEYQMNEWLDINKRDRFSQTFKITKLCKVHINLPSRLGFDYKFSLMTAGTQSVGENSVGESSVMKASGYSSKPTVRTVDLPPGTYVFSLWIKKNAAMYQVLLKSICH